MKNHMKNHDIEISYALKNSNEYNLLEYFRQDMNMSDSEWQSFCKRYYRRDTSTIADFIQDMYGIFITKQMVQKAVAEHLNQCRAEIIV